MGNLEHQEFKTGLLGELLVRLRLNAYGANTGSVDRDTGTDIVIFVRGRILTAQVKSGINRWNNSGAHGVDIHFQVKLRRDAHNNYLLDDSSIRWKRLNLDEKFVAFTPASLAEFFNI